MDFTRNTLSYAYHDGCLHGFYVRRWYRDASTCGSQYEGDNNV